MGKLEEEYEVRIDDAGMDVEEQENVNDDTPEYGSEEWSPYVLSLFHADEMIDGNPLCHGLRRVANLLLGDIVASRPTQVFPSEDPNGIGRATVVYEIVFNWMGTGELRTYGDVAEVWHANTEDLFAAHAAATACTKAEGRVLRKALMVKCLAAEELVKNKDVASIVRTTVKSSMSTTGEIKETDHMSDAQLNFIDSRCKSLNINLLAYVSSGANSYKNLREVKTIKKMEASTMIQKLNEYQTSGGIPENIKNYDSSWRE